MTKQEIEKLGAKLALCEQTYTSALHRPVVIAAVKQYRLRNWERVADTLSQLPTTEQLLEKLMGKLKGKSVAKTLKRIAEGKTDNDFVELKGLFSLGTHVCIECEKGNQEFRPLITHVFEKLGTKIFSLGENND